MNENRLHDFSCEWGLFRLVDVLERERLGQPIERESAGSPHCDELRDEHFPYCVTFEDAHDVASGTEQVALDGERRCLHADEAARAGP